jgi:hypothetical protein
VESLYYNTKYSGELMDNHPCLLKEIPVLVTDVLMTLQKGSPFLDRVNEIIGRLIESGIPGYLLNFSPEMKASMKANSKTFETVANDYSVLTVNNIQSALYLFLFGNSLGLMSFLMEMLYFKMHHQGN